MAGGVNLKNRTGMPPVNPIPVDADVIDVQKTYKFITADSAASVSSAGVAAANKLLNMTNDGGNQSPTSQGFVQTLSAAGVNFNPKPNPLNDFANYTYHIRWFMTNDIAAYNDPNVNGDTPNADSINKTVIAESGVTAGFNIVEFELKNVCGPNARTLNTNNIGWTMKIREPFGISLLDKMLSSARTQPILNYMRAPYFIDVWFNGYDENGVIIAPKTFYQLYRVSIQQMDVDMTAEGSLYTITGYMDGNIGNSNQIAIPPAGTRVQARTVGDFFKNFATVLNSQQRSINERNFAIIEYEFKVPQNISNWTLRNSDVDKHNNRNASMDISYQDGTMNINNTPGISIENIVNYVISMCPEVQPYIKGGDNMGDSSAGDSTLTSQGIAKWFMVHSSTKIKGWDPYTRDYTRTITYTLVPYETVKASGDVATISKLEQKQTQTAKLNALIGKNTLSKLYEYIYTGHNTEVINFDIHVENLYHISLPQWEATNTYHNATQGLSFDEKAVYNMKIKGQYTRDQQLANLQQQTQNIDQQLASATSTSQIDNLLEQKIGILSQSVQLTQNQQFEILLNNRGPGSVAVENAALLNPEIASRIAEYTTLLSKEKALRYAEDVAVIPISVDPMPIVVHNDNKPAAQNADQSGDSNKARANLGDRSALPSGRSFVGSILGNMFDPSFFNEVFLTVRGDPYWMGQSNIKEVSIAEAFGQGADPRYANYIASDHMFVLSFRSGENYNEETGLMEFSQTSDFFNGVYGVVEVTNTFKDGSFTQVLHGFKDIFAQKIASDVTDVGQNTSLPPTQTTADSSSYGAAGFATETTVNGVAFGGAGL